MWMAFAKRLKSLVRGMKFNVEKHRNGEMQPPFNFAALTGYHRQHG
jgi:hypothetical protein